MEKFDAAIAVLRELMRQNQDDVIIKLSLAELLYDTSELDAGDAMPKELLLALRYQISLSLDALGRKEESIGHKKSQDTQKQSPQNGNNLQRS